MIEDLFAFMRYERDWLRLQSYHEARQHHQSCSYRMNANRSSFNS